MQFNPVTTEILEALQACLEQGELLTTAEHTSHYGHDETEDLVHPPEVVVLPRTTAEVAAICEDSAELDRSGNTVWAC